MYVCMYIYTHVHTHSTVPEYLQHASYSTNRVSVTKDQCRILAVQKKNQCNQYANADNFRLLYTSLSRLKTRRELGGSATVFLFLSNYISAHFSGFVF